MRAPKFGSPTPVRCPHVLFVEGDTPSHFFEALLKHLGLDGEVEIWNYGGITELARFVRGLASTSDFRAKVKAVGVVRDAETDPHRAHTAISGALSTAGLADHVRRSFYVLPDPSTAGMIETLCLRSIDHLPIRQPIRDFFQSIKDKGGAVPEGIVADKHTAQVYLATRGELDQFVGLAAYRAAWPFDHDTFKDVSEFLRALVNPPPLPPSPPPPPRSAPPG